MTVEQLIEALLRLPEHSSVEVISEGGEPAQPILSIGYDTVSRTSYIALD